MMHEHEHGCLCQMVKAWCVRQCVHGLPLVHSHVQAPSVATCHSVRECAVAQ